LESLQRSFSGEAVQRPEENQVEAVTLGVGKEPFELGTVRLASALVVDVFVGRFPALRVAKLA
jgi:hypothetical protein